MQENYSPRKQITKPNALPNPSSGLKHISLSEKHNPQTAHWLIISVSQNMQCPTHNFFKYNTSLCACNPGYYYNTTQNTCSPFTSQGQENEFMVGSGVDYSINIPANIFAFDTIKKFTQSQAVFLETTLVVVASWLMFCVFVRFGKLGDGSSNLFRLRWWISRLDVTFATRHWLVILFLILF